MALTVRSILGVCAIDACAQKLHGCSGALDMYLLLLGSPSQLGEASRYRDIRYKLQGASTFPKCWTSPPAMLPWTHLQTQGSECLPLQTAAHHEFGQLTWRGRKSLGSVDTSTWDLRLSFKVPYRLFGIWFMKECGSVWNRYSHPDTMVWGCLSSDSSRMWAGGARREGNMISGELSSP